MKKSITSIFIATILLVVSSASSFAESKTPQDNIFIDSSISKADQALLLKVMKTLDVEDRENVLYIREDGSFIANKPEVAEEFKKQNMDKLDTEGRLLIQSDQAIKEEKPSDKCKVDSSKSALLASTGWKNADESCGGVNTGAFRRVISDKGFSRLHTYIHLPSKTGGGLYINSSSTKGDTAFIYTGATDKDGDSVDIGLQYNNSSPNNYPWDDTWAMFLRGDNGQTAPTYANFKPGQIILMKFYVPSNNNVALNVTGYDKSGVMRNSTLTGTVSWLRNFKADGTGMNIKRVTSMAQLPPEDLTTGSYVGSKSDPVFWDTVRIGKGNDSESVEPMTIGWFCGYQTNNVLIDFTDHNNEKIIVKTGTLTP
ncbi:hypothetical protein [Paenibacillus sp. YN15]|uniref:hypothetical protein n=1 Tax=Paenibacillus sp. YN15 TaxID=1742774 RepID=UPI000DCDF26A|nr:hypothetical protein [Paenibacillus sp. YN15]RAU96857.1 hypothetical protein DQG13_20110 [Paenibacillus sp. YN15]